MKNNIILLFFVNCLNGQEYKLEEKVVTGIFEVNGKPKSEIFSAINK